MIDHLSPQSIKRKEAKTGRTLMIKTEIDHTVETEVDEILDLTIGNN